MSNRPPILAMLGLTLLWLTPFSIIKNMQIFSIALVIVGIIALLSKSPLISANSIASILFQSKLKKIKRTLLAIYMYIIICSLISILILSYNDYLDNTSLAWRYFSQLGATSVYFFTIICGYHMAAYVNFTQVRFAIYIPLSLMLLMCIYQTFSESWGLPYYGNYAYDLTTGLRPSGLAGEPKYLAGYCVLIIFFLFFDLVDIKIGRHKILINTIKFSGLIASVYYFLMASSANGYLSFFIVALIYLKEMKSWLKFILGPAIFVFLFWLKDELISGNLKTRESHQNIFDNISNIDLSLFDDLIALPLMVWRDNVFSFLIGYGPGLMHFFALRYISYAAWLTDETYIEGNLAAITYISNFGLILFVILFIFFTKRSLIILNSRPQSRTLNMFFVSCFFIGVLFQGNTSVPFYLSLGWILYWSNQKTPINLSTK